MFSCCFGHFLQLSAGERRNVSGIHWTLTRFIPSVYIHKYSIHKIFFEFVLLSYSRKLCVCPRDIGNKRAIVSVSSLISPTSFVVSLMPPSSFSSYPNVSLFVCDLVFSYRSLLLSYIDAILKLSLYRAQAHDIGPTISYKVVNLESQRHMNWPSRIYQSDLH